MHIAATESHTWNSVLRLPFPEQMLVQPLASLLSGCKADYCTGKDHAFVQLASDRAAKEHHHAVQHALCPAGHVWKWLQSARRIPNRTFTRMDVQAFMKVNYSGGPSASRLWSYNRRHAVTYALLFGMPFLFYSIVARTISSDQPTDLWCLYTQGCRAYQ